MKINMIKILYFSWLRENIGVSEEIVETSAKSIEELVEELKLKSDRYKLAFANLDNVKVVKLLSRVIMDLAEGEIKQNLNRFDSAQTFSKYINKSYCKTASLIANSTKAAGVLCNLEDEQLNHLYEFGKNIGLAFQVVDDILDFTGNDKQLGKPAVSDLASGYLTAPVLYALEENENLSVLINRELVEKEDLNNALNIVMNSQAIKRSRKLAEDFALHSKEAILWLPDSEYKRALLALPEFVLSRLY